MAVFPSITPTASEFKAPQFPTKATTSLSGVTSRRVFGNRAYNATLAMTFDNITNNNATLILQCWNNARGTALEVTVPDIIFTGAGANLTAYMKNANGGVSWHFAEEPSLTRGVPGYSTVSVRLEATLDA